MKKELTAAQDMTPEQLKEAKEFYFGPEGHDHDFDQEDNPYDSHQSSWDDRPSDSVWESPKFDRNFWKYLEKNHPDVLDYFIHNSNWMMCGPELLNSEMYYSLWNDYKDKVHPDTGKRMEGRDIIYQYFASIGYERDRDNIWVEYLKKNKMW